MGKISAEDRLAQLKAEIAQRKLQRQQQQQDKPATTKTAPDTADSNNNADSKRKLKNKPKQEKPETKTIKDDLCEHDSEDTRIKEEQVKKRKKKKEKLSSPKLETNLSNDECDQNEEREHQKQQKGKAKNKKAKSKNKQKNDSSETGKSELSDVHNEEKSQMSVEDEDSDADAGDSPMEETEEEADPNVIGGFSILGNFSHEPTKPVKRKLPDWLENPTIIGGGLKKRKTDESREKEEAEDEIVMKILDDDLKKNLHDSGIERFFPVQRQFIPEIWKDLKFSVMCGRYGLRPRDFCVSAPTGSGKTLAYTLPIIQCLKKRWEPHVWAVVVLPVRDLAEQVYNVFCHYCAGTPLKVGLIVGKTTFTVEQESLVVKRYPGLYHSLVDIVVATPGRLVDHVHSTPGFDLSHLRFLVIDEADRMMEDIKHDWLSVVETAAYSTNPQAFRPLSRSLPGPLTLASAPCNQLPLQKLLFSATLSHNPEKLERLNLFMPRLMTSVISQPSSSASRQVTGNQQDSVETAEQAGEVTETADGGFVGKYTTPEGLTEYLVETEAAEKPLMVLHFMHNLKFRSVLCFTNSVETTHRLCLLIKQFGGLTVKEFSSRMPGDRRKKILKQFSKGKIDLLVCSDVMARGMDVDNVRYVISYDNPPYIRTYIHRVGRTARAGRAGTAVSLLEKKEFFHFKKMMKEAGKWQGIREMKLSRQALKPLVEPFQSALSQLPQIIKEEKKKRPKH